MTSVDSRIGAAGIEEPFSFQAMQVVAAARRWAAQVWERNEEQPVEFMDEPPTGTINTDEERARRDLLDAVHDLEHHSRPAPRPLTLFDPPA